MKKEKIGPQKILLTAILKDDSEIQMAERMLESFSPHVQGIAVAITGISGDNKKLQALLKKYKAAYIVTTPETHPEIYAKTGDKIIFANFAAARMAVFSLASELQKEAKYDWWSWADVDDILMGGEQLQAAARQAALEKADSMYFPYWYQVTIDKDGNINNVIVDHLRERLLKPDMFKWVSRLHEITVPADETYQARNALWALDREKGQACMWVHLSDNERFDANLRRNTEILKLQFEEEKGKDPRTIYYLAKTYIDLIKYEPENTAAHRKEARRLINEYLHGKYPSGWAEERSMAYLYLGNMADEEGKHHEAIENYHKGIQEHPAHHLLYLLLAKKYADLQMWEQHDIWLNIGLSMEPPKTRTTMGTPQDVQAVAAGLKFNDAWRKNDFEGAIHWLKVRDKITGQDNSEHIKVIEDVKEYNDASTWVFNFARYLKKHNDTPKIRHLLEALPADMKKEIFVHHMANEVVEPKTWDEDTIVYFAGPGFEEWSDESLQKGLGGSETAIVKLSREWAKLGYKVTVYGDPGAQEGTREGVTYLPWTMCNWNDKYNVFIVWRVPEHLDRNINAKMLCYDAHDIESQTRWTPERMDAVDKVFFKSKWHRTHLPKLPDEKAVVIHNGIDV